jgi:hypothetical protein
LFENADWAGCYLYRRWHSDNWHKTLFTWLSYPLYYESSQLRRILKVENSGEWLQEKWI